MKKIILIIAMLFITGCGAASYFEVTEDSKNFKEEYEALNKQENSSGTEYQELNLDKSNPFKYLNYDETMDFLDNGTGVLFFSRPGCPYCRSTMNATIKFAEQNKILKINYFNPEEIRTANNDEYKALLAKLDAFLPVDVVTQKAEDENFNPTLKRVVVPHIFFIVEGEVISHYQEGRAEFRNELTLEQETEIMNTYKTAYGKYLEAVGQCNTEC